MSWGLKALGLVNLEKTFKGMIPGPTDTWQIGPNTSYDVYVEWGTSKMPSRPAVKQGMEKALQSLKELEAKSATVNALLRALALKMEGDIKDSMTKLIYEHPLGTETPTGNLRRSVTAEKL